MHTDLTQNGKHTTPLPLAHTRFTVTVYTVLCLKTCLFVFFFNQKASLVGVLRAREKADSGRPVLGGQDPSTV